MLAGVLEVVGYDLPAVSGSSLRGRLCEFNRDVVGQSLVLESGCQGMGQ